MKCITLKFSVTANQNRNDEGTENLILLTHMYLMDFVLVIDIVVRLRTAVTTPNGKINRA